MKHMAMYAYIAGTTNDDINDKGSIACQIDFLKQTNVDYDAYYVDTFPGVSQWRLACFRRLILVYFRQFHRQTLFRHHVWHTVLVVYGEWLTPVSLS